MRQYLIDFIVNTVLQKWLNYNIVTNLSKADLETVTEIRDLKEDLNKAYASVKMYKAQIKKTIEDNESRKEQGKRELIRDLYSLIDYQKATYNWQSKSKPQIELAQVNQVNETNRNYLAYRQIHTLQDLLDEHFKQIK